MNKLETLTIKTLAGACVVVSYLTMYSSVSAQNVGHFEVGSIEDLLWKVVGTIQLLAVPIIAIALAAVGIGIMTSGEDDGRKSQLKGIGTKILIGGLLIFSAVTLAKLIRDNINL